MREFWGAARAFSARGDVTFAASLAFYSALSFGPMVILMLRVTGALSPGLQRRAIAQVSDLVGPDAARVLDVVVETAKTRPAEHGAGTLVSILLLAFSATGVFGQIQATLNRIWEVQPKEGVRVWPWIRKRILSFGILLAIAFILAVTLVLNVVITAVLPAEGPWWNLLNLCLSVGVFTVLFALMYWLLPDAKVSGRLVWRGAVVAAALFALAKYAIGIYLGQSSVAGAYGAASTVIVLLIWSYVSALVFFYGAELVRARTLREEDALPPPEPGIAEEASPRAP